MKCRQPRLTVHAKESLDGGADAPVRISTLAQEQSEPFSCLVKAIDRVGFKDSPEATCVINGGSFGWNIVQEELGVSSPPGEFKYNFK